MTPAQWLGGAAALGVAVAWRPLRERVVAVGKAAGKTAAAVARGGIGLVDAAVRGKGAAMLRPRDQHEDEPEGR